MAKAKKPKKTKSAPPPPAEYAGPPPPPPDDVPVPGYPDTEPPELRPLNQFERRYVEEFLWDRIKVRAYSRSHPAADARTARVRASEMHKRPHVKAEIDAATRAQSIRCQVRADNVLKEISRIAYSDIGELVDPTSGTFRHPRHLPIDVRRAVQSIKVSRERRTTQSGGRNRTTVVEQVVEYKMHPKNDALGKLANHLGLNVAIPPLESLLASLPADLSQMVRRALVAQHTTPQPSANGRH